MRVMTSEGRGRGKRERMRATSLGSAAGTEGSPPSSLTSFGVAEAASDDVVGVGVALGW